MLLWIEQGYLSATYYFQFMFQHLDNISKVLVLDLDAHQVSWSCD